MVRIKEARVARGLTQTDLANMIDVSQQAVHRWETGERDVRASTIVKIAKALNVTSDFLLGVDDRIDMVLSDDERTILDMYNGMDDKSKSRLIGYADGLSR